MTAPERPGGGWRWLTGGGDSWRRILLVGVAAGFAIAVVASVAALVVGDGIGSLDGSSPTSPAPAIAPEEIDTIVLPTIEDLPPEPPPEVPTEPPIEVPPEALPPPTVPVIEPTLPPADTPVVPEEPLLTPVLPEG